MVGETDTEQVDREVRLALYRRFAADGIAPVPAQVSADTGLAPIEVERSLQRLHDGHVLVLAPGSTYVWMANPFSALPTAYRVTVGARTYWGNCVWDALGIVAMLGGDGLVDVDCADCGEPTTVEVADGVVEDDGTRVVHYAVPARHWWDAIGFS